MLVAERRRAQRFDYQSPVIVRWWQGSEMREVCSVSENISSNGIYFSLPEGIKDRTPVEVVVTLPNQVTLAGPLRVRFFGRVKRCEWEKCANQAMAAAFEKCELLPNDEYAAKEPISLK